MNDNALKSQAFKLKGRLYTITAMQLLDVDPLRFEQQLAEVIAQAPRLFDKTPIVIDCSSIDCDALDLQNLCQQMREYGLIPVAIQGANSFLETVAPCLGMAVITSAVQHDKRSSTKSKSAAAQKQETIKTKIVNTPVRSGQQVVSKGGDLVITAAVSHGAELLSDGNIHVYGPLRGRALAGIAGNKEARIFCQALDAELVAIAGFYRLRDAIEPIAVPCQIYLQDEHIQIDVL